MNQNRIDPYGWFVCYMFFLPETRFQEGSEILLIPLIKESDLSKSGNKLISACYIIFFNYF